MSSSLVRLKTSEDSISPKMEMEPDVRYSYKGNRGVKGKGVWELDVREIGRIARHTLDRYLTCQQHSISSVLLRSEDRGSYWVKMRLIVEACR